MPDVWTEIDPPGNTITWADLTFTWAEWTVPWNFEGWPWLPIEENYG